MDTSPLHTQPSDPETDHSLAYRLGSSVLNNLPLYGLFRHTEVEEKVGSPIGGTRTPPPGYYDLNVLERERGSEGSSTVAELKSEGGSVKKRISPLACGTEDTHSEGSDEDVTAITSGYLPDTGTKRFLQSFGSLLKTLGSEAPAADMVSNWLPGALGVVTEESSAVAGNGDAASAVVTGHGECGCFQCFQQRQLYLLWLQSQGQSYPVTHQQHFQPQQMTCASCQRPTLPPRPSKPLLHRLTAAFILQIFTFAFLVYPHIKTFFLTSYAWERRNHIMERVLTAVLVLSERLWLWAMWLLDGSTTSVEWRGEIGEQRVRKWVVKSGGEVVSGVVDGLQMGMSVWGAGGNGKGKGRVVVVG